MTSNVYEQLAEPFPPEVERTLNKSGRNLTYIPVSEVIARLNRVLGVANWSSETIDVRRDNLDPDWVIAHVRITATIDGQAVVRDGVGGQTVKRTKQGGIVDLGDEFKGAESDAFKKAAQKLGIGLYLARTDEALYAEQEYYAEEKAVLCEAGVWNRFVDTMNSLDNATLGRFKNWWGDTYPGLGRPAAETCTTEQVADAILRMEELLAGEAPATGDTPGCDAETWDAFSSHLKSMEKGELAAFKEWWGATYPDGGKPTREGTTTHQIVEAITEILRLRLGAEQVAG